MKNNEQFPTKHWLKILFFILIFIIIFFCIRGVTGNANIVAGFDNTMEELNPFNDLKTVLQNHDNSIATNILDIPVLLVFSILRVILNPLNAQIFFFSCLLLVGALGVFVIAEKVLRAFTGKIDRNLINQGKYLASLFYIFSIGSIQLFLYGSTYIFLLFGLLPWIGILLNNYFKSPSIKAYMAFYLVFIFLFPSFKNLNNALLVISAVILGAVYHFLKARISKPVIIKFTALFFVTSCLPVVLYFSSLINTFQMDTFNTQGNFFDLLLLKLPLLTDSSFNQTSGNILDFKFFRTTFNLSVIQIFYLLSMLAVLLGGVVFFAVKSLKKYLLFFACVLSALFLTSIMEIPGFNTIFTSEFYNIVLIPLILFYSLFFAAGFIYITNLLNKIFSLNFRFLLGIVLAFALYLICSPALSRGFLHPNLFVNLADEYINLRNFINKSSNSKKIITLPLGYSNGIFEYKFGLSAASVLPLNSLSREDFVNDASYLNYWNSIQKAVAQINMESLLTLTKSFNVEYILLDYNLEMELDIKSFMQRSFEPALSNHPEILFVSSFNNLKLYKIR